MGEVVEGWRTPEGLEIQKVRVPFGVILVVYEARPNVTVDAAALCLKTGNAVILRGGSDAYRSNRILAAGHHRRGHRGRAAGRLHPVRRWTRTGAR